MPLIAASERLEERLLALHKALAANPDREFAPGAGSALAALVRQMAADGTRRDDPGREVLARLGDKWSPLLLLLLQHGSFRHATLRRLVVAVSNEGKISQRMLTLRLRRLERDGLIARERVTVKPLAVRYSLTELGRGLLVHVNALVRWTGEHSEAMRRARAHFK